MPPPFDKSAGDIPPEISIFQCLFSRLGLKFYIFQYSKYSVGNIREETKIWGRWIFGMNPHSAPPTKSKLRGAALAHQVVFEAPLPLLLAAVEIPAPPL